MIIFIILLTLLFLGSLIAGIWWFIYKRKYTREKFAFTLLLNYTTLLLAVLDRLSAADYFLAAVNYLLFNYFSMPEIQVEKPSLAEKFLDCILLCIYIKCTSDLHKNWDGGKSVDDENNARSSQEHIVLLDAYRFIRYKDARFIVNPENIKETEDIFNIQNTQVPVIAWRQQLADLLKLTSVQYKIDVENEWYSQENCFISRYGQDNQVLAILCSIPEVSDAKIISFINLNMECEFQLFHAA